MKLTKFNQRAADTLSSFICGFQPYTFVSYLVSCKCPIHSPQSTVDPTPPCRNERGPIGARRHAPPTPRRPPARRGPGRPPYIANTGLAKARVEMKSLTS